MCCFSSKTWLAIGCDPNWKALRHPAISRVMLQLADSGPGFPEGYCNNTSWELHKSTKATGVGMGIDRSTLLGGAKITIEQPHSHG